MPIAGQQTQNIINQINLVRKFVQKKRKQAVPSGFVDNRVLKLHYKYTFYFFVAMYMAIWHSWFQKDVMTCVNKFNADAQIRQDFLNICFTYIYMPLADGSRRYLFFYRYIHFVIVFIAGMYYLIHKFVKHNDDLRSKKLLNEIEPMNAKTTETDLDNKVYSRVPDYIKRNLGMNDSLYYKNLVGCFLALTVDCVTFRLLDWTLHDRFLEYGYMTLPFVRDPETYMDYMSQTFPPFAECTVGQVNEIINKREDTYGCHLTVMELYEKVFYFIWCWLCLLIVIDIIYILHLVFFLFPWYRFKIQKSYKVPEFAEEDADRYNLKINTALSKFSIGDTFLLYRLQKVLTHTRYYVVLCKVALSLDADNELHGVDTKARRTEIDQDDDDDHIQAFTPQNTQKRGPPFPPGMGGPQMGGQGGIPGWKFNALRGEGPIRR